MNPGLLDAFRHNSWATTQLLRACHGLSNDDLHAAAAASFGNIITTFNHIILSDALYLYRLSGNTFPWVLERAASDNLHQLEAWAEQCAQGWEQFLAEPLDSERLLILDQGHYQAHAGILVAQALHHGNAHREQICAILTGLGVEPPDLQAWAYGEATGRGRERSP